MEHWGFNMETDEIPVGRAKDLRGQKFGRLTVLYRVEKPKNLKDKHAWWKCKCECGNIINVNGHNLINGNTTSCGCKIKEVSKEMGKKYGKTNGLVQKDKLKSKDLTGQRFGKLVVLHRDKEWDKKRKNKTVKWVCQCDCGNIHSARTTDLKQGKIKSCGCLKYGHNIKDWSTITHSDEIPLGTAIDLKGQRFGKLIALYRVECPPNIKKTSAWWKCQCDCGNTTIAPAGGLKSGGIKSCGCLYGVQYERCNNITLLSDEAPLGRAKNLKGQRFGKLTVLYRVKNENFLDGHALWKCQCDCGNITIVSSNNLQKGAIISCGCSLDSKGVIKIKQLLNDNHLFFQQEYVFNECKNINLLRFDFYVNNKYLIEYDGEQHFYSINYFGGKEKFQIGQECDIIKNEYCKTHNIPLIRIPYTHYDKITIDDLRPETSQFLIT